MPILVIQHPVKDFAAWKKTFDSDPIGRGKSGVKRHAILQPHDDPNVVVVHLEFESKPEADAFLNALKPLWTTTADTLGVKADAVQTRILDEVESVTYEPPVAG